MKTRFKIESVPSEYTYKQSVAINAFKQYRALRLAAAQYINAEKKLPPRINKLRDYIRDNVKNFKHSYQTELSRRRPTLMVVRVGRLYEKTSEIMRPFMSYSQRLSLVSYLKDHVRQVRRNNRYNTDPLSRRRPNDVLLRYQSTILEKRKAPSDTSEYVGIEIECVVPSGANMGALLPFARWVDVGSDGSIHHDDGEEGKEIRVCVKRDEIRPVVSGIMAALNSIGATVNKSCGLHVHLDQRKNPTPELTFQKLVRSLGLLYTVVPKSRRENTYCKRNRRTTFQTNDRYKAVNSLAFRRYKTLEIRLFGGTLNAEKVINWIETLEAIAHGEMVNRCPKNFDTARKYWTGLSDVNIAWLKARQAEFFPSLLSAPTSESDSDMRTDEGITFAQREEAGESACAECDYSSENCTCDEFVTA